MTDYQNEFIAYALQCGVLKFGEFKLKSGRVSPYFFNSGLFNTGAKLGKLGEFYAKALYHSGLKPDILYGPAYKGMPLVCAAATAYAALTGIDMPYAFNRKEAKDHGEGGVIVGSALAGKVLIIDDVITSGISIKESIGIIVQEGARPMGVLIALDRQEKAHDRLSAVQEVMEKFNIPVLSIINLGNIISYLETAPEGQSVEIIAYRSQYGA